MQLQRDCFARRRLTISTDILKNVPFDDLELGMEASETRLCHADDLYVFAKTSGNFNPMHQPEADGYKDGEPESVAPSMWVSSSISAVLGGKLSGPGTLYRDDAQTLRFRARAHASDELTATVRLTEKGADRLAKFDTWVAKADGTVVVEGEAEVFAPEK